MGVLLAQPAMLEVSIVKWGGKCVRVCVPCYGEKNKVRLLREVKGLDS